MKIDTSKSNGEVTPNSRVIDFVENKGFPSLIIIILSFSLYTIYNDYRTDYKSREEEYKAREELISERINSFDESLQKFKETLEKIDKRIEGIESKIKIN